MMRMIVTACCLWAYAVSTVQAQITCATWNLDWFPSGKAEHYSSERVEQANCSDAADVIRPIAAKGNFVMCLQELRDEAVCSNLVVAIGVSNLSVAAVSEWRNYNGRHCWQQCGIISTYPVLEARYSYWRSSRGIQPPRGYVYALLDVPEGPVGVFNVHLKSNYAATTDQLREINRTKRRMAVQELIDTSRHLKTPKGRRVKRILLAGDFNADGFVKEPEVWFETLEKAKFSNPWKGLPREQRGTHIGTKRYGSSTLDYVFYYGFSTPTCELCPVVAMTDHRCAVFHFGDAKEEGK